MSVSFLKPRVHSLRKQGKSPVEIVRLLNGEGHDGREILSALASEGFPRFKLVDYDARITALLNKGWAAHAIAEELRKKGLSDEVIISAMANRGHRLVVSDTGEFGYPPIQREHDNRSVYH